MKDALIRLLILTNIALLIVAAAPTKKVLTGQAIDVRVDSDDGPTLHVLRDNKVLFHEPPAVNFEKGPTCAEWRGALAKNPRERVLTMCRQRMSEEACQACIGAQ